VRRADEIRGAAVTGAVSAVAGVPEVRSVLIGEQRRIVAAWSPSVAASWWRAATSAPSSRRTPT